MRQNGRQTGITKNLATFWQTKIIVIFFRSPVTLYAKIIMVLSPLVFHSFSSKLQRNLKEK